MKIAFNPSTVAALITPPNNKDITFDLRGRNIFARGVKFCGTDTWRDIKINNVSIGSNILDLRNGSNTTLTNTNGVVTINSTWRPVVDNLTSDSTTSSLSAKQGKILKSLIDGKSNSGHTHDDRYLRLTGGTMASNALITFADSGSWGTDKGPQGTRGGLYWTGQSDYAKLYAEETREDNLDLVIQFGDDNSNGLSIRNKDNTQTSYISSSGVITTGTFKGNLDWSYITNKPATATRWPSWAEVTGKPSSFTPSTHTHGLSNSVFFLNMPSISGNAKWKEVFGYPVNYNLLLSVRINSPAPEWCVGNYGSGILYGGSDTKGFMSSAYNEPLIMWAGGNGSSDDSVPKWYIGIKGIHKSIYNLATIASEANAAYNLRHSHANKSVLDGITSALVNNWNTAYNFVNTITGADTDKVINKWDEIVNFLAGITEDNKLNTLLNSKLSVYELANNTNVGAIKNNGIYYSTTDASSGTLTNSPFNTGFVLINMTSYDGGDDLRRSRLAFNAYGEIKVSDDRDLANTAETWYNVLTSKNSGISGSTIKLNGTSITVYSSSTADGRYVKKSGDTMSGALNFANNTWNKVGDDSYVGDCNVSGHFGIKAANTTYPGIAFFNNSGAHLGNLTAYNGNIKYGAYSLRFLDNGNTSVSAGAWMNPFNTYDTNAVTNGQAICVWGQSSYLSNLAADSGDMSLWLKRVNAKAATLNMVLDGEYYANGNLRLAHVSEIPNSLKNPYALTISLNGTSLGPYDGSAAKNINITPSSIGAATSGHTHDDRYYTKAESNAKYITDITTSVNKLTFTKNGSNINRDIIVNNVLSLGRRNPLTERNAISGIYTYGTYSATDNLAPSSYFETLGFGEGAYGTIEIGGSWISGGKLYWRALRDCCEDWFSWKTILDSSNYSGILDSRYYTESEVNNLLSKKLNTSDFNWTNLPGKLAAGNEFNIVNAGFNAEIWFNYLPINDRSKTASIHTYIMGNGAKGMASVTASGFVKNGSSDSYVLLGGGGHKAVSDFATVSSLNNYVTLTTPQTISGVKTFSTQLKFTVGSGTAPFTVSSNTLVTNLNADLLDGWHLDSIRKNVGYSWSAKYRINNWSRIIKIDNYSNILLAINFSQFSQASNHLYLISTGYGCGNIVQLGANGYSSNSAIKIRLTENTATSHNVEIYSTYGYNGATELSINCNYTRIDGNSTITTYLTYTAGGGTVRKEITSSYSKIVANLQGNSDTTTKLQTPRQINGTNFDGSANITTSYWGTTRTISLTGAITGSVSTNGGSNITINTTYGTGNITNLDNRYVKKAGDTMLGNLAFASGKQTRWTAHGTSYITDGNADSGTSLGSDLANLVISSWLGVSFTTSCSGQTYTNKTAVGINCRTGIVYAANFVGALSGNATTATKLTSSAGNAALPIYFSDGKPVACTASSIFSNLSNSGNNISVTIAGQNRTLTVAYASTTSKLISRGNLTAYEEGSTTKGESGVNLYTVYNNGYPVTYGNLLHINGSGAGQILAEWCGNSTLGHLYYRSKRDNSDNGWSTWGKIAFVTDNVASATKLQTPRKIWGQSFDGTADVSGSLSGVGHIQFSADNSYSIGTTTSEAAHTYTRQVWARHLNASRVYTGDTNLYIGYNNTAQVKFFSGTKQSGDGSNERMTISTNGNVGIGTNTPAYKLHVNGTFRATNSTVSNLFVNTGDATLKIYTGITADALNDGNICFLTSIDATDGQSHAYPTLYLNRCNIVLQPRGGLVYIGTNPGTGNTTYKLYVNSKIFSNGGFVKNGSSDSYVLLGGGGHKLISDFATAAQGVGTIISISKSLTPTTSWIDTGIKTDSATFPGGKGSYIVQVSVPSSSGTDGWGDLYTGYFSLYTGTNSSTEDEILLHGASHALLKRIYLKTKATANTDGTMHFYIASEIAFSAARTINFKFRKLI